MTEPFGMIRRRALLGGLAGTACWPARAAPDGTQRRYAVLALIEGGDV